jgi:hypothetical protein
MRTKRKLNPLTAVAALLCGAVCFALLSDDATAGLRAPGCHNSTPAVVAPAPVAPVTMAAPVVAAPPCVAAAPSYYQPPSYQVAGPPVTVQAPDQQVTVTVPGATYEVPGPPVTVTPPAVALAPVPTYQVAIQQQVQQYAVGVAPLVAAAPVQPVAAVTPAKLKAYRPAKLATWRMNRKHAKTPRRDLLTTLEPIPAALAVTTPVCGALPAATYVPSPCDPVPTLAAPPVMGLEE